MYSVAANQWRTCTSLLHDMTNMKPNVVFFLFERFSFALFKKKNTLDHIIMYK